MFVLNPALISPPPSISLLQFYPQTFFSRFSTPSSSCKCSYFISFSLPQPPVVVCFLHASRFYHYCCCYFSCCCCYLLFFHFIVNLLTCFIISFLSFSSPFPRTHSHLNTQKQKTNENKENQTHTQTRPPKVTLFSSTTNFFLL